MMDLDSRLTYIDEDSQKLVRCTISEFMERQRRKKEKALRETSRTPDSIPQSSGTGLTPTVDRTGERRGEPLVEGTAISTDLEIEGGALVPRVLDGTASTDDLVEPADSETPAEELLTEGGVAPERERQAPGAPDAEVPGTADSRIEPYTINDLPRIPFEDLKLTLTPLRFMDSGEEMERLKHSLETEGMLQPIVITRDNFIVIGTRRATAAMKRGQATVSYLRLGEGVGGNAAEVMSNAAVRPVDLFDLARQFAEEREHGLKVTEIAKKYRHTVPAVRRLLAADALPPRRKDQVRCGRIPLKLALQEARTRDPEITKEITRRLRRMAALPRRARRPAAEDLPGSAAQDPTPEGSVPQSPGGRPSTEEAGLLTSADIDACPERSGQDYRTMNGLRRVPIANLRMPENVLRRIPIYADSLNQLAASFVADGQLQPITITREEVIVDGLLRALAATFVGWVDIAFLYLPEPADAVAARVGANLTILALDELDLARRISFMHDNGVPDERTAEVFHMTVPRVGYLRAASCLEFKDWQRVQKGEIPLVQALRTLRRKNPDILDEMCRVLRSPRRPRTGVRKRSSTRVIDYLPVV